MSTVVRPNRVRFGARTPPVEDGRAVELFEAALSTGVEGVVAGYSDQVDPGGVDGTDPHVLYVARLPGTESVSVRFVTDLDRVDPFVGVVDRLVGAADRLVEARLSVRVRLDAGIAADPEVPEGWRVDRHDLHRGTGVELTAGEFALGGTGPGIASGLADRLRTARAAVERLAPDVVPAAATPTDPVEEYYRVRYGDRVDPGAEDAFLTRLRHPGADRGPPDPAGDGPPDASLVAVETTVVDRGLDAAAIRDLDEGGEFPGLSRALGLDDVATLVAADATLVAAEVTVEVDGRREERTATHLVATADGDWRLVR